MLFSVQKHFLESFKSFFVDDFIFNEKVRDFTFNTYNTLSKTEQNAKN